MKARSSSMFPWRNLFLSPKACPHGTSTPTPLSLKVLVPTEESPHLCKFTDAKLLARFVQNHRGLLRSFDPLTQTMEYHKESQFAMLDSSRVYEVYSAFYNHDLDRLHHHQTADKAFEEKSRLAVQSFFKSHNIEVKELPRVWYNEYNNPQSETAIEWEGVWQGHPNQLYLLESKHVISSVTVSC